MMNFLCLTGVGFVAIFVYLGLPEPPSASVEVASRSVSASVKNEVVKPNLITTI